MTTDSTRISFPNRRINLLDVLQDESDHDKERRRGIPLSEAVEATLEASSRKRRRSVHDNRSPVFGSSDDEQHPGLQYEDTWYDHLYRIGDNIHRMQNGSPSFASQCEIREQIRPRQVREEASSGSESSDRGSLLDGTLQFTGSNREQFGTIVGTSADWSIATAGVRTRLVFDNRGERTALGACEGSDERVRALVQADVDTDTVDIHHSANFVLQLPFGSWFLRRESRAAVKGKNTFRFDGREVFLTYARCDMGHRDVVAYFQQLAKRRCNTDIIEYCAAVEPHADGTPHIHVWLRFRQRIHVVNSRVFDLTIREVEKRRNEKVATGRVKHFHPNVVSVTTTLSRVNHIRYCRKYGEVVEHLSKTTLSELGEDVDSHEVDQDIIDEVDLTRQQRKRRKVDIESEYRDVIACADSHEVWVVHSRWNSDVIKEIWKYRYMFDSRTKRKTSRDFYHWWVARHHPLYKDWVVKGFDHVIPLLVVKHILEYKIEFEAVMPFGGELWQRQLVEGNLARAVQEVHGRTQTCITWRPGEGWSGEADWSKEERLQPRNAISGCK
jgi:hypothetical protein